MCNMIFQRIEDSIKTKQKLLYNESIITTVDNLADEVAKSIQTGHKLVICGNGGSASDALHFAGEIVGRFQKERKAWPAIVLNADVASMTAIANDYGFDDIFARQAQGQCKPGDMFVGISTSGNSENVYRAVIEARKQGCKTAALLGKDGGKIKDIVEYPVIIPSDVTARIQECHILIIHILCEIVENKLG